MALIGRIFVVAFAFLLAALAAAIVVAVGMLLPEWPGLLELGIERGAFAFVATFGALAISLASLLPAALIVVLAEALRLRSPLFYGAVGGFGLWVLYRTMGFAEGATDFATLGEAELAAAAGIVGGTVYWLLAGRNAGRWCERRTPQAS